MNTIFLTRARARTIPLAQRKVVVDFRRHAPVPNASTVRDGRGGLRAKWTIDPTSGRLACHWASDDEATDSRRCRQEPDPIESGPLGIPEALAA